MGIPANLSSVPATVPYVQYIATASQTQFPYPFVITQDSDLVVAVNGVTLGTDVGYTVSGQGNSSGGNITFALGQTAGAIITLFRNIPISRITQIAQNSGFSSTAFNAEYNNIYLIMQQLEESIALCLQLPITNVPSGTGTTLTPANYANKYLSFDSNGNPTPAVLTSSGSITGAIVWPLINPQTAVEIAAGVTPSNFQYSGLTTIDVRRYGWSTTNTAAQNSTALATAITALDTVASAGGTILIPPGQYSLNPGVAIPQNVKVRGSGTRATALNMTASGSTNGFTLGGSGSQVYYGTGLTDLSIIWTGTTGFAVNCLQTIGAEVARLYIEGETISNGRTTGGVQIDGFNNSAFFNCIDSVIVNHMHIGFHVTTTGSTVATMQDFRNCSMSNGDVATDTTSVGFLFDNAAGNGSLLANCDAEGCQYGYDIGGPTSPASTGPVTMSGCRAEGNSTSDVIQRATINTGAILGCLFGSTTAFTDNSGAGFQKTTFVGNFHAGIGKMTDQFYLATFNSQGLSDLPLTITGWPSQVNPVFAVKNSSLVTNFSIAPNGEVSFNNQVTTGAQTATFSATNKPGSGTTAPTKWLPIVADGTTYYMPLWT